MMEPLNDSWWLEPPEELTEEEQQQRINDACNEADLWYKEQQDALDAGY